MVYLFVIAAFILGWIAHSIFSMNVKRVGDIVVKQDEDGTYLMLQIKDLESITSRSEVTLGVKTQK